MLAAESDFEVGSGLATEGCRDLDQPTDTGAVERLERVSGEDPLGDVFGEEATRVVAAETEGRLGQIVGAEGDEVSVLGDFVGEQRGAWDFDHRPDFERDTPT